MTKAEAEKLLREHAEQRAFGEKLLRENAELRAVIASLTEQLAKLTERVAELLAVAQRRQRKPSAERLPEPRPSVVGDAKRAFERIPVSPIDHAAAASRCRRSTTSHEAAWPNLGGLRERRPPRPSRGREASN